MRRTADIRSGQILCMSTLAFAASFAVWTMQRARGRYSVIVIGAEPRLSYNRILLSSLLTGEVGEAAIELKPRGWWNGHGVTTAYGQPIKTGVSVP